MWNMIQCAMQGRGHIKEEIPCQDKTFLLQKDDIYLVALADGAGSAKFSHYGAAHITQYICHEIAENFDSYFHNEDGVAVKKEILDKIQQQLHALAEEKQCEVRDLASTLLFAAVRGEQYLLLHIGDGVIGYSRNHELKIASFPENGDFANTTVFTTSRDALQTMKLIKGSLKGIDGFILMSDGTEASLYDKRQKKLAVALKKIIQIMAFIPENKAEERLYHSFSPILQATTDDCSLVILAEDFRTYEGYTLLAPKEKMEFLQISSKSRRAKVRLQRYDDLLKLLETEQSAIKLSQKLRIKRKYIKRKYLNRLVSLRLAEKKEGCFIRL